MRAAAWWWRLRRACSKWRHFRGAATAMETCRSFSSPPAPTASGCCPKGGRSMVGPDAEAARQEAFEEAGIEGQVAEAPVGSYSYIRRAEDGSTKPSQAIIFSLRVRAERKKWDEKKQRRRRWFPASEAAR